jgi:hypothetical protein
MLSTTEWAVTIADPSSARQLADALTVALDDARGTINDVVLASVFQGDSRPIPVSVPAELTQAVRNVQAQADGLDVIARKDPDMKWHSGSKPYDAAKRAGLTLLQKSSQFKADMAEKHGVRDPAELARGPIQRVGARLPTPSNIPKFLENFSAVELGVMAYVGYQIFGKSKRRTKLA